MLRQFAAWAVLCACASVALAADAGKPKDPAGKAAFQSKCASCHGKDAKGNASMAKMFKLDASALNLVDETSLGKSDEDLSGIINKGSGKMPAYAGKLKAEEISGMLAFLRSLAPPPAEEKSEKSGEKTAAATEEKSEKPAEKTDSAPGDKLFASKCASCHGKDAKGNAGMAKMFKTSIAALDMTDETTLGKSDEELTALIGKGIGKMPGYASKLSADEIAALVAYMRSLGPKSQ